MFKNRTKIELSRAEHVMLVEESYSVDHKGNAKKNARPNFIQFEKSLLFSFAMFAKVSLSELKLDVGKAGYGSMLQTNKIRDGLMHPKNPDGLSISTEQLRTVREGLEWFRGEFMRFIHDGAGDKLLARIEAL